jgi:hypothetical protein
VFNLETLLLISFAVFIAFVCIFRLIYYSLQVYKKQQINVILGKINDKSPYRKPEQLIIAHNDKLFSKDLQKEKEAENNIAKYNPDGIEVDKAQEEVKIVGIAEPQGFWSKFIISQKLGYILARLGGQQKEQGYWVNLIKAQAASQGKDQSRGR